VENLALHLDLRETPCRPETFGHRRPRVWEPAFAGARMEGEVLDDQGLGTPGFIRMPSWPELLGAVCVAMGQR